MSERDSNGRWQKGTSGNPGGRKRIAAEVIEAAQALSETAIATLERLLTDPNPMVQLRASEILLNRAWGTPAQFVNVETKTSYADELDRIKKVRAAASDNKSNVVPLIQPPDDDDKDDDK
jgi:hypothetical protein